MKLPEYVSKKEVREICSKLGISDWTKLKESKVTPREARAILKRARQA